ncbi:MAG: hypothetical protein AVDCRST_MAG70-152 [uncultured Thermomicrobiales bacterium]|uniref:Uncharacterized protein n=1 Tax=uncultured Thermomicrobiales bacterium TaxID=1645740 RepID=A0A6J4U8I5_9BACT|nr:MAG: hypothetical protein AVDCRST_MAG70-152 [uncultured Thermomicrobiales bacterium]
MTNLDMRRGDRTNDQLLSPACYTLAPLTHTTILAVAGPRDDPGDR